MTMRAPGADSDGTGTVTILEVLRTLLGSKKLVEGKAENTVEFHWYSGKRVGCWEVRLSSLHTKRPVEMPRRCWSKI
jgi:hypothetical protein